MFIPIGLDQTSVRRLPWVSIGIIAANLAVFLAMSVSVREVAEEAGQRGREVMQYWSKHPYLTLPKSVAPGMSEADREHLRLLAEAMSGISGRPAASPEERAEEQHELDGLVQRFRDAAAQHPYMSWGLIPSDPKPLAFLTCMFVHAGWLHLLGNMLFFYLTGPFLEDAWGRPLFAAFYLASGVVASLVFIAAFPSSNAPLVGASGAVAGLMGAFLVRFVRRKVRFFYFYFIVIFRTGTVDLPAWLVLPLWFCEQLLFASLSKDSGVAYRAHVGGFAFGFVAALAIKALRIEERFIAPKIEQEISVSQHPALDEGMDLLLRGETAAARAAFATVLAVEPRNADAHLGMWQSHCVEESPEAGAAHLVQAIEEEVRRGDLALALDHWRELSATARQSGPAALRWRLACALEGTNREAAVEIFNSLASDPAAGILVEKAARRLDLLGEPVRPRSAAAVAPAPAAASPGSPPGGPPAVVPIVAPAVSASAIYAPPPPSFWEPPPEPEPPPDAAPEVPEIESCTVDGLQEDGLLLRGPQGASELLPFDDVEAVSVAGISASPRPFLVLDLLLRPGPGRTQRVERLLSTTLDPRGLLGRPDLSGLEAFRQLVGAIAAGGVATVAPAAVLAPGAPFPMFPSLEAYERDALTPLLQAP
ncbi:MAG: rhomboid family intramembrane serine protease [Acidobacteria bacterium]|nr:MAG: rhomboid family intramembrane serine protease [Acidobacteriota bacterium]